MGVRKMQAEMKIDYIAAELLHANEENPNKQKDVIFNKLVENIQEIGFVEPIMVRPIEDGYEIISGHHRFEAGKIVGYSSFPCVVMDEYDKDMADFQLVRMNMLKGDLDPVKFTKLYNRMAEKYGDELVKESMALVDAKKFDQLYVRVVESLPPALQKKLESTKKEIKDIDGLSRILNQLFSTYGDTLQYNFMVLDYSKKEQLWVQMEKAMKKRVFDDLVPELTGKGININDYFNVLLVNHGMDEKVLADAKQLTSARVKDADDGEELNFS